MQYAVLRRPFKCQFCVPDFAQTVPSGRSINRTPVDDNARAQRKGKNQHYLRIGSSRLPQRVCCEDAFSREVVSANRSEIPKPEVAIEWEHLNSVANRLTPYHPDAEFSISIGNNCPKAIRPREIVAGGDDEPYALRTALGWGVIGRVCKSSNRED